MPMRMPLRCGLLAALLVCATRSAAQDGQGTHDIRDSTVTPTAAKTVSPIQARTGWWARGRRFSVIDENDAFGGSSDSAYTQGLRLRWDFAAWPDVPWFQSTFRVVSLAILNPDAAIKQTGTVDSLANGVGRVKILPQRHDAHEPALRGRIDWYRSNHVYPVRPACEGDRSPFATVRRISLRYVRGSHVLSAQCRTKRTFGWCRGPIGGWLVPLRVWRTGPGHGRRRSLRAGQPITRFVPVFAA